MATPDIPRATGCLIPLSELEPDAGQMRYETRVYARRESVDAVDRSMALKTGSHAEVIVDAIDEGNADLVAAAVRGLVAHVRAGRARRAELDVTVPAEGAITMLPESQTGGAV